MYCLPPYRTELYLSASGFGHYGLQLFVCLFLHNRSRRICSDLFVAGNRRYKYFKIRIREGLLHGFSVSFGLCSPPKLRFIEGIYKLLYGLFIIFDIASGGKICGIWDFTALGSDGSDYVALAFLFDH